MENLESIVEQYSWAYRDYLACCDNKPPIYMLLGKINLKRKIHRQKPFDLALI